MGAPPDEEWLRELLEPLTEALAVIHAEQCFHRDIAPDNVILLKGSQRPLLLDFGAARRVIGDMTQALTVILKPGYAPVEQYAEVPGMKQGPWTDVYALAAVVYYAIIGKTPPTSVGRLMNDNYVPLDAGRRRSLQPALPGGDRPRPARQARGAHAVDRRPARRDLGMAPSDIESGKSGRGRRAARRWPAAFRPAPRRLATSRARSPVPDRRGAACSSSPAALYFALRRQARRARGRRRPRRRRSTTAAPTVPPPSPPAASAPPVAATAAHRALAARWSRRRRPGRSTRSANSSASSAAQSPASRSRPRPTSRSCASTRTT